MAKYRVLERSFIGNRLHEPGAVVEHNFYPHNDPAQPHGTHGPNLEPIVDGVTKKGRKAKDAPPADDTDADGTEDLT